MKGAIVISPTGDLVLAADLHRRPMAAVRN